MSRDIAIDRVLSRAASTPNHIAYYEKYNNAYQPTTWKVYAEQIEQFAAGLIALGLKERQTVAILGYNCPQWVIACLATQMADGISVGVYTASSPNEIHYVVEHSEAEILVVENADRFEKQIRPHLSEYTNLKHIVVMQSKSLIDDKRAISFEAVQGKAKATALNQLKKRIKAVDPKSVATLIYTSGTTGHPKGVMLSHESIAWTVKTATSIIYVNSSDSMLSYLPLAHIAEQVFSVYLPVFAGVGIYFAESMEKVPENLKEAQPTLLFGVPRVYEKFYDKVKQRLDEASGLKATMLGFARKVATQVWTHRHQGESLPLLLTLQYALAKRLVFSKLKPLLGLGQARICVSGAAPIAKEIIEFFLTLDIPIYEVYGQSEDCGPTTINIPGSTKLGTVGRPLPGMQVKIAEDGEILVKGPNVFMGYFKDEKATRETLVDGWLYSGDVGEFDKNGYLKITDRKKDLLITAGGKNVAPQNLEGMLKQIPLVSLAVVVGDRRKYLSALLTPNADNIVHFAKQEGFEGKPVSELVKEDKVLKAIQAEIEKINRQLAPVEQIKRFELLENDFTVESGELTPTMKIKRKVINARYGEKIESFYQ